MARDYSVKAIFNASTKGFERGVDRAVRATRELEGSVGSFAKRTLSTAAGIAIFDNLQKAADALGQTLSDSIKYYDTMTSFSNGLKVLGVSTTDIKKTQEALNTQLKGTGVEATSATSAISALVSSGMKIDKATDTAIAFSKGMALTGTSAEGAEGFMRQYAQGVAKGKFELEDFNTMNENAPGILDQVAKSLLGASGNSRKLYEAMQSGKISVNQMNEAVMKLGQNKWDKALKNQTMTVSQGMTEVKKSVMQMGVTFIEKVNQIIQKTTGIKSIGDLFLKVSEKIDILNKRFKEVSPEQMVQSFQKIGIALGTLGGMFVAFNTANHFGGMVEGLIGAEQKMVQGFNRMKKPLNDFTKFLDDKTVIIRVKISEFSDSFLKNHPKFNAGVNKFRESVNGLSPAFSKALGMANTTVSTGTKTMIGTFNLGLRSIAPAIVVGTLLSGMGVAYQQYQTQIDSFIQTSIQKGPEIIGKLATSISERLPSLITSGVQMLGKIVEGINANLPALLQGATQIISSLVNGLIQNMPQIVQQGISLVSTLAQGIAENLPTLIQKGVELILALATSLIDNFPKILSAGFKAVSTFIKGIVDSLPKIALAGAKMLISLLDGVMSKIPGVNKVWDKIKNKIDEKNKQIEQSEKQHSDRVTSTYKKTAQNAEQASSKAKQAQSKNAKDAQKSVSNDYVKMSSDAENAMSRMTSGVNLNSKEQTQNVSKNAANMTKSVAKSYDEMARATKKSTSQMTTTFDKDFNRMANNISSSMKKVQASFVNSMKDISSQVNNYLKKIINDFKNAMNSIVNSTNSGMNKLKSVTSSNLNRLSVIYRQSLRNCVNVIRSYYSQMYNAGAYITIGLNNGIASKSSAVYANVQRMANNIERTMRKAMDIHSPSRVFRGLGGYISEGLAIGILDNEQMAINSTKQLARATTDNFNSNFSGVQSFNSNQTYDVGNSAKMMHVSLNIGGKHWGDFVQEVSNTQGFTGNINNQFNLGGV